MTYPLFWGYHILGSHSGGGETPVECSSFYEQFPLKIEYSDIMQNCYHSLSMVWLIAAAPDWAPPWRVNDKKI